MTTTETMTPKGTRFAIPRFGREELAFTVEAIRAIPVPRECVLTSSSTSLLKTTSTVVHEAFARAWQSEEPFPIFYATSFRTHIATPTMCEKPNQDMDALLKSTMDAAYSRFPNAGKEPSTGPEREFELHVQQVPKSVRQVTANVVKRSRSGPRPVVD